MKGTFWNNRKMEGKPVTTQFYTTPLAVTTAGMHNFAPNVQLEDFSAKYETVFTPKESGEYVINVEATGHYEVYVDGERKQQIHSWRSTPSRTAIQAEKGRSYRIEVLYKFVKTWGANMKIDVAKELPIDYQSLIAQLKGIETVVFVGGISPALEGEEMPVQIEGFKGGDRTSIELPRTQREMIAMLHQAGKKIIFINCSGSAVALEPESQNSNAILQAWYPGEQGGTAVASVLFGDCNPSGKLPVTFYRNTEQLPDFLDYTMKGRTYRYFTGKPLWPFGHGLSYTTFKINNKGMNGNSLLCEVTNTGKREGTEVVQLYVKRVDDTDGPAKSLRGYQRVTLKPGETQIVKFDINDDVLTTWDKDHNIMRALPGEYQLMVRSSSDNVKACKYKL
jgi:beta-glucosidase